VSSGTLAGRRTLVTGASRGIGAEIAVALAAAGAAVGAAGRDPAGLARTCERIESAGGTCTELRADLSTVEGARGLAAAALAEAAHWDVLVNNAATLHTAPLAELDPADLERSLTVNLVAPMALAQMLVPGMIEAGAGRIVNVSSLSAFRYTRDLAAYSLSKAALNHLTMAMAVEWGPHGVLANAVCPTIVATEMAEELGARRRTPDTIPVGRFGRPREVADLVVFLAGGGASFLNGTAIPVDGGVLAAA
jgi:NAD(P)-dependent dehydrogenase (short-subunit alcohol dehydrogenase family)